MSRCDRVRRMAEVIEADSEIQTWLSGDAGLVIFVPRELSVRLLDEVAEPGKAYQELQERLVMALAASIADEGDGDFYSEAEMREVLSTLNAIVDVNEREDARGLAAVLKNARWILDQAKAKGLL